jgi:uracil-DNA glycosylase family 4
MRSASPADLSPVPDAEAPRDCPRCPRLVTLRGELRSKHPDWWNAPVPAFGDPNAWLAIVGLAPGRKGANRTGRPFTGDFAGELLFSTLLKVGLAEGDYRAGPADGLRLNGAVILNAVKCLPPGNKPTREEQANCRPFLMAAVEALPNVRCFIALGKVAHDSLLKSLGMPLAHARFGHGAIHDLSDGRLLIDSYHCSRQNVYTRRLTSAMFVGVFVRALRFRCPE